MDAIQNWHNGRIPFNAANPDDALRRSDCVSCGASGYWVHGQLVWPGLLVGDPPSEDLERELRDIYEEARGVAGRSPRAAAALLRLLVERLVVDLGQTSGTLNDRIGRLSESGEIPRRTVDALDAVRITGNNAVHAGQIDPSGGDDIRVVNLLFSIVNMIVENTRTLPRQVSELLGDRARDAADSGPAAG